MLAAPYIQYTVFLESEYSQDFDGATGESESIPLTNFALGTATLRGPLSSRTGISAFRWLCVCTPALERVNILDRVPPEMEKSWGKDLSILVGLAPCPNGGSKGVLGFRKPIRLAGYGSRPISS